MARPPSGSRRRAGTWAATVRSPTAISAARRADAGGAVGRPRRAGRIDRAQGNGRASIVPAPGRRGRDQGRAGAEVRGTRSRAPVSVPRGGRAAPGAGAASWAGAACLDGWAAVARGAAAVRGRCGSAAGRRGVREVRRPAGQLLRGRGGRRGRAPSRRSESTGRRRLAAAARDGRPPRRPRCSAVVCEGVRRRAAGGRPASGPPTRGRMTLRALLLGVSAGPCRGPPGWGRGRGRTQGRAPASRPRPPGPAPAPRRQSPPSGLVGRALRRALVGGRRRGRGSTRPGAVCERAVRRCSRTRRARLVGPGGRRGPSATDPIHAGSAEEAWPLGSWLVGGGTRVHGSSPARRTDRAARRPSVRRGGMMAWRPTAGPGVFRAGLRLPVRGEPPVLPAR